MIITFGRWTQDREATTKKELKFIVMTSAESGMSAGLNLSES